METKVEQLEGRLGSIHTTDVVQNEKNKFLNTEVDSLREQRMKLTQEIKTVKDQDMQSDNKIKVLKRQLETLNHENKFLAEKVMEVEAEKNDLSNQFSSHIDNLEKEAIDIRSKEQRIA